MLGAGARPEKETREVQVSDQGHLLLYYSDILNSHVTGPSFMRLC